MQTIDNSAILWYYLIHFKGGVRQMGTYLKILIETAVFLTCLYWLIVGIKRLIHAISNRDYIMLKEGLTSTLVICAILPSFVYLLLWLLPSTRKVGLSDLMHYYLMVSLLSPLIFLLELSKSNPTPH